MHDIKIKTFANIEQLVQAFPDVCNKKAQIITPEDNALNQIKKKIELNPQINLVKAPRPKM